MEVTYSNENVVNGKHKFSEPSKSDPGSASANVFAPQGKPLSVVSKTSEQQSSQVFQFDSSVVLSISQLADAWLRTAVNDLEAFARYYNYYLFYCCTCFIIEEKPFLHRHAHRSTINMDDVKLLARRNPSLVRFPLE